MKRTYFTLAFAISIFVATGRAWPTEIEDQLTELRQRVDALELENELLRQTGSVNDAQTQGRLIAQQTILVDEPAESEIEPQLADLEKELAATTADCPVCEEPKKDLSMSAAWNHGLELSTKDKAFRVHVGGRTQFDLGWFAVPDNVQDNINHPYENGADFRRARLRVDGTMYETIDWAAEYDFIAAVDVAGTHHTANAPTDLWITFKEVPWCGNVRIGNQKPAIGFEHLVSSRYLPFMERSYNQDAFYGGTYNGFWPGIACFDNWGYDDLGTWNLGLFKPTNNVYAANATDGDVAGVARLTHLLWYECDGASLLHIGGSAMTQTTVDRRIIFRARDAIRTGLSTDWPSPASTGTIAGDDIQWFNGELVAVDGPWTFQSEYLFSTMSDAAPIVGGVTMPSVGSVEYHGGYAQLLYFLTGEHDKYNKKTGAFDRLIPYRECHFRHGCFATGPGAWQVGARYNFLDLNDNTLNGGILHNATLGLNWYVNPNLKFQFDYMATHRDAPLAADLGDGWIHGWGTRMAYDF
ncbi:MAG: hypothetical protein IT425_00605 [Pirellulales bacterium]|nr:hypothetical protein [Pirellulales bacterium]